jgi:hypothetical protein
MSEVPAEAAAVAYSRDGWACACCGTLVAQRPHSARRRSPDGGDSPANLLTFLGDGKRPNDPDDHRARVDSGRDLSDKAKGYAVLAGQDPALVPVMITGEGGWAMLWLAADGKRTSADPGLVAA